MTLVLAAQRWWSFCGLVLILLAEGKPKSTGDKHGVHKTHISSDGKKGI